MEKTEDDGQITKKKSHSLESKVSWILFALSMSGFLLIAYTLVTEINLTLFLIGISLFLGIPTIVFVYLIGIASAP